MAAGGLLIWQVNMFAGNSQGSDIKPKVGPMNKIKMTLRQNAFHTLYHAVEHLAKADRAVEDSPGDRYYDADGFVVRRTERGSESFYVSEFQKPPPSYDSKFALLHLIQATELLMKAHLAEGSPDSIFTRKHRERTIDMGKCVREIEIRYPSLLSGNQRTLLLRARDYRNAIEHYEFEYPLDLVRQICIDLLAMCGMFSQRFFGVNMAEEFSFDPWTDASDPVGGYLQSLFRDLSEPGKDAASHTANLWAGLNLHDGLYVCLCCGLRGASIRQGRCVVCGADTDERVGRLIDELDEISRAAAKLRRLGCVDDERPV